jgi:deoxyribodipyrimidine photolyase-related protein
MVISSAMFLCEIEPQEAHRWFMEMFVDSADWVMGPNVYGMGQNADGGLMTTKPYLCGSNYLINMGRYAKGPWCEELDGLYWRWIIKNQQALKRNPRMAQAANAADRLEPERLRRVLSAGERALARLTV